MDLPDKVRYLKKWKEMSIDQIIEADPEKKIIQKLFMTNYKTSVLCGAWR
ncbi:MAG: hypothetical protein GY799_01265 [Desulfobulbaceae bacterium]|nr:hypothetical protein [Desulfobulbaceae bacterium]